MSKRKRHSKKSTAVLGKKGNPEKIRARIRDVGADKFGLVTIDPHKEKAACRMVDFYGKEFMAPCDFSNTVGGLANLTGEIITQIERNKLKDIVVCIERTGRYHCAVKHAMEQQWTVQMIHPFATKRMRQPADPGVKTDVTDLYSMERAAFAGFGCEECEWPDLYKEWQVLSRMRESLAEKCTQCKGQIHDRFDAIMPGYAKLFGKNLWESKAPLAIAELLGSAKAILAAGADKMRMMLGKRGIKLYRGTIDKVMEWAREAPTTDAPVQLHHRVLKDTLKLLRSLWKQIKGYECDELGYLVNTEFVRLLAASGVNVVSASRFGSELGPIKTYLKPTSITGRAGLYPTRYSSADTDRPNGPMIKGHNAELRDALISMARSLRLNNAHYAAWAAKRAASANAAAKWPDVKVLAAIANRYARLAFVMLNGQMEHDHPALRERDSVLGKIMKFGIQHGIDHAKLAKHMKAAVGQLPHDTLLFEIKDLGNPKWTHRGNISCRSPKNGSVRTKELITEITEHIWTVYKQQEGADTEHTDN